MNRKQKKTLIRIAIAALLLAAVKLFKIGGWAGTALADATGKLYNHRLRYTVQGLPGHNQPSGLR